LTYGGKFDTIKMSSKDTRPVSWIKAARKSFEAFPKGARDPILRALTAAAEGRKLDTCKPMKGLGVGVFEVAVAYRTDAYRTVYVIQLSDAVWGSTPSRRRQRKGPRPQRRSST
jgi:phage-related protein